MYKPFKEYLNSGFANWCVENAAGYTTVKSLARGGGVTLRNRQGRGRACFLILQHVTDRDLVSLTGAWAAGAWLKDWPGAETRYYWSLDAAARRAFVEKLTLTPRQLACELEEGVFTASQLDADIIVHELEVGDGGVPYEAIAALDLTNPVQRSKVEIFLGARITASLAAGNVPPMGAPNPSNGLHSPFAITARLLSWECWFEHVLERRPSACELSSLCGPVLDELTRQAVLLIETSRSMDDGDPRAHADGTA